MNVGGWVWGFLFCFFLCAVVLYMSVSTGECRRRTGSVREALRERCARFSQIPAANFPYKCASGEEKHLWRRRGQPTHTSFNRLFRFFLWFLVCFRWLVLFSGATGGFGHSHSTKRGLVFAPYPSPHFRFDTGSEGEACNTPAIVVELRQLRSLLAHACTVKRAKVVRAMVRACGVRRVCVWCFCLFLCSCVFTLPEQTGSCLK